MKIRVLLLGTLIVTTLLLGETKPNMIEVTTLIENSCIESRNDLTAEHGVSMYIKYDNKNILFDTGRSDKFIKNAKKLGLNISDVDILIISHAHKDHGGGLKHFIKENYKAKIYLHENTKKDYYFKIFDIGLDNDLLKKIKSRVVYINKTTEIFPNISLLASFDIKYIKPKNENLYMKDENGKKLDPMEHEIVLTLKRNNEIVIFSGCSHNGILNMTDAALQQFPSTSILGVFGGFHLMNPMTKKMAVPEEVVIKMAKTIQELPIEKIYTGHCTGEEAYNTLKKVLKHKVEPFKTGSIVNI